MAQSISVPTDPTCIRTYSCILAPSAEIRGDHVAVVQFPEHIRGTWRRVGTETWYSISRPQGFYFTEEAESYQLKLWTNVKEASAVLTIPYTVGAIYAPVWAYVNSVINATPDESACSPCITFNDLKRSEAPLARVVYASNGNAVSFSAGYITYTGSGGPVTVSMDVVAAGYKLCLGPTTSIEGPLLYKGGVPTDATITAVTYTYYDGTTTKTVGGLVNPACTDGSTEIIPVTGTLDCHSTPGVIESGAECAECVENTGSYVISAGTPHGYTRTMIQNPPDCSNNFGAPNCTDDDPEYRVNVVSQTLKPPNLTPYGSARPCNWTGLEFQTTLVSSYTYSGTNTPTTGVVSCSVTYTKTAGNDTLVATCDTNNWVGTGCVFGFDLIVRSDYLSISASDATFDIPCTGYKLVQRHSMAQTNDQCIGNARMIPKVNNVILELRPR